MYRLQRRALAQDSGYATRMAGQGGSQGRPPGSWNPGLVCSAEELPSPSPRPYRSGPILIGFMHGVKNNRLRDVSASSSWPRKFRTFVYPSVCRWIVSFFRIQSNRSFVRSFVHFELSTNESVLYRLISQILDRTKVAISSSRCKDLSVARCRIISEIMRLRL